MKVPNRQRNEDGRDVLVRYDEVFRIDDRNPMRQHVFVFVTPGSVASPEALKMLFTAQPKTRDQGFIEAHVILGALPFYQGSIVQPLISPFWCKRISSHPDVSQCGGEPHAS